MVSTSTDQQDIFDTHTRTYDMLFALQHYNRAYAHRHCIHQNASNMRPTKWYSWNSIEWIILAKVTDTIALDGKFVQSHPREWFNLLYDIDNRINHNSMTTFWCIVVAISVTLTINIIRRYFALACRRSMYKKTMSSAIFNNCICTEVERVSYTLKHFIYETICQEIVLCICVCLLALRCSCWILIKLISLRVSIDRRQSQTMCDHMNAMCVSGLFVGEVWVRKRARSSEIELAESVARIVAPSRLCFCSGAGTCRRDACRWTPAQNA